MWKRLFRRPDPAAPKTRLRRLDEFYQAIRELGSRLEAEGHPAEAERLDTLMHTAWTTGSELLGELMLALSEMRGDYSPEVKDEIANCEEFARHYRKILGIGW